MIVGPCAFWALSSLPSPGGFGFEGADVRGTWPSSLEELRKPPQGQ